ncbi:MAG: sulfatase-like hydrolase/transferase, partial [Armatimonadota bacterium]
NVANDAAIKRGLNPGILTFSEALRDAGYRLAYAGKWHVSAEEDPCDRGWEELLVTCGKDAFHDRRPEDWARMARTPEPDRARERGEVFRPGWGAYRLYGSRPNAGPVGYEHTHDYKVTCSAIQALPELAASGRPWVLYVGPSGPHDPFIIPEKFATIHDPEKAALPPSFHDTMDDKPRVYQRMRHMYWGQLSEAEVRESIAHYWGYCAMLDSMFGELLQALDATGQAENTLVVYTSDHGDYCGAHGLYCKGVPAFREAYHVPCVVRWPRGLEQPDREVSEFLTHADFLPTFMQLAGLNPPEDIAGRSFLPFLRNEVAHDWPQEVHSQLNGVELYYSQRAVRTKKWRYVYNGFDIDEMYDLEADPHETVNLAAPSRHSQPLLHTGESATSATFRPWPHLPPDLEAIRKDLLGRIWRFNKAHGDGHFNPYATVALAPVGPMDAFA